MNEVSRINLSHVMRESETGGKNVPKNVLIKRVKFLLSGFMSMSEALTASQRHDRLDVRRNRFSRDVIVTRCF